LSHFAWKSAEGSDL